MNYKDVIFEFVDKKVTEKFPNFKKKVFFAYELVKAPSKPYLMISELADETIHRPFDNDGQVVEFKQVKLTFRIVTSGVNKGCNNPDNMALAEKVRDYLRALLCSHEATNYFLENKVSNRFEHMSANRPDHQLVSGGYVYAYEFDCPFDYENSSDFEKSGISAGVNLEMSNIDGKTVDFEVNKEKSIGY